MPSLNEIVAAGRRMDTRPWPRALVTADAWREVTHMLAEGRATLLGLWGEPGAVHMAAIGEGSEEIAVVSLDCAGGTFPSVGALHPPAIRLERAIRDLYGLTPTGAPDTRPWLDHGRWTEGAPKAPYAFLPVEGENLHQIPVGPVHAGIIEPGHFRFHANGETVVRLEERLGYVHKGIDRLMAGKLRGFFQRRRARSICAP